MVSASKPHIDVEPLPVCSAMVISSAGLSVWARGCSTALEVLLPQQQLLMKKDGHFFRYTKLNSYIEKVKVRPVE
jgi:hypothetical protein